MSRHCPSFAVAAFAALVLAPAGAAALSQPDGTVIPQGSGLQALFDSRGESIDAVRDAATVPETFVPGCDLTFHVLQRNAGMKNSFGWYNVTGRKPEPSELHEFLACTDDVGTVKVLSIRSSPAYAGGEVGFYEATGDCATTKDYDDIFFSEKKYNPDAHESNPFVHLLIYDSTVTPRAFYFGWEDLLAGGDNDFDDLTTFVTGITCSGGGGACSTGRPGVCDPGTMQCQRGQLACVSHVPESPEVCDGLDNDCNGEIDDGADLCPPARVCDRGQCVRACAGELGCGPGKVCLGDRCVEIACRGVTCDAGKRCVEGVCVGPCDGVVCPYGQVCRVGRCVDPCAAITCDDSQVCVDGVCTDRCQCTGCPAGSECLADGRCVIAACAGQSCPPGTWCAPDGSCQDACEGASCPDGERCVAGVCEPLPAAPDAGVGPVPGRDGGGLDPGADGGVAGPGDGGSPQEPGAGTAEAPGGCGCPVAGSGAPGAGGILMVIAVLGWLRCRRA